MVALVVNSAGADAQYRRGLDACFPGAWTDAKFDWFLSRPFGESRPDVLGVKNGGELVAGMGVNYRRLAVPGGEIVDIAILTAAWTLPRERGRWHMSRLVRAAVQCGELRGCGAVISFVTRSHANAALLKYMGASTVPTYHLRAPAAARIEYGDTPAIEPCARLPSASKATWRRSTFTTRRTASGARSYSSGPIRRARFESVRPSP